MKRIRFAGGGFMYNYYLGIAKVLQAEIGENHHHITYEGESSGAIVALLLAMRVDFEHAWQHINAPLLDRVSSYWTGPLLTWNDAFHEIFLRYAEKHVVNTTISLPFRLSVTTLPCCRKLWVDDFENHADAIAGVVAGAYLPPYGKWPFYCAWRDMACIDGAIFSDDVDATNTFVISTTRWWKRSSGPKWWWFLLNSNIEWAAELQSMGEADALAHVHEIRDFLSEGPGDNLVQ